MDDFSQSVKHPADHAYRFLLDFAAGSGSEDFLDFGSGSGSGAFVRFRMTPTVSASHRATARSGFPSLSKSATSSARGLPLAKE